MSDDTTLRGPPDPSRINVNQAWELRYWCEKLGVSEDELRRAVQSAGNSCRGCTKTSPQVTPRPLVAAACRSEA